MVSTQSWFHVKSARIGWVLALALGCEPSPQSAAGAASASGVPLQGAVASTKNPPPHLASGVARAPGAAPAWLGEYVDQDPELAGATKKRSLEPAGAQLAATVAADATAAVGPGTVPLGGQQNVAMRAYPQNVSDRPVPRVGDQPWKIDEQWQVQHQHLVGAQHRAEAKLVFLGDSITQGWRMAPAYKQSFGEYAPLNLGLSGDHTQNVLWRIEHGALDGLAPGAVVLMIGINNLGGGFSPAATASGVRAIIAAIQARLPATPIVLLAILPARQRPDDPLRQKVTDANRLLSGQARAGRVLFYDVGNVLLEPDGTIKNTILRDYLHPTAEGYDRLTAAVLPLVEPLLE